MLLILLLFIFSFSGTLYVTFKHSKDYYQEQLKITAQDTATSLGLSLSAHTDDKAVMLSMVNAIFDRGYFTKITIKSVTGKTLISRTQEPTYHQLPNWFIRFVAFPSSKRSALIMSGWMQKGKLTVISDPSLAYFDLWKTTRGLFVWFLGLSILSLIFAYLATKILFRPLIRVAEQARAICSNVFQIQSKLPRTKELRLVTDAMNRTVTKLKALFKEQAEQIHKLRERTYLDSLTQVGNRSFFELKLRHLLSSEEDFQGGHLVFLDIAGLKEYNLKYGFQKGDELVKEVCELLQSEFLTDPLYLLARIAGATFACVIVGKDNREIAEISKKLLAQLQGIFNTKDNAIYASIGVSNYHCQQDRGELLTHVDNALTKSRHAGPFQFEMFDANTSLTTLRTDEWRELLQNALRNHTFEFYIQEVRNKQKKCFHQEIFAKLPIDKNSTLSAGEFIPMAEKLDFAAELDLQLLTQVISAFNHSECPYSINLSSSLILSDKNRQKLLDTLTSLKTPLPIHFEISEQIAIKALDILEVFIQALNTRGYQVGLDRVGATLSPLFYLSRLKCQFLKIDGSLTRDIVKSKDKQFFVRHLKNAANTLDILLIGTAIESEKEWAILQELGIDWGQGRYLDEVRKI
jgi:diguanylate cyclase (GGDEF)-like protein